MLTCRKLSLSLDYTGRLEVKNLRTAAVKQYVIKDFNGKILNKKHEREITLLRYY